MIDPTPFEGKALQAITLPPAAITAYEGSIRSGKTFTSLVEWIRYCRTGPPGMLLIAGRTERTILNNIVQPLQDMLGPRRVAINRGLGTVSLLGRTVLMVGANNEASRTKIQGLTLAGAYVDEAGTLPESFFSMLVSRLSVAGARLWLTSNPESPSHWLKTKWLDRARIWVDRNGAVHHKPDFDPDRDPDIHRVSWALEDNTTLPPDYVRNTKAMYTGLWYRRYILGEWVAAEGAIYDMWDPDRHVVHDLPPMARHLGVGVDYGTTNATAGILLGLSAEPRPRLYLLDEWRYDPATARLRLTDGQLSAGLCEWMGGRQDPRVEWVLVDPAAASLKVQLHADGARNVTDADNDVAYGIRTVASLLGTGDLLVSDRCTGLIAEFPGYSWNPKATEKGEDKPIKTADHSLDAARYAVATTESVWRPILARAAA